MNKVKFNIYGLLLFLIIMIPNIIWFIIPTENDILRNESITPTIDNIASIFQVIMILFLCFISKEHKHKYSIISLFCIVLYFICWILYYCMIVDFIVVLGICIFPCLTLIFYEVKNKNWVALIPTIIFSVLHLSYGIINYL